MLKFSFANAKIQFKVLATWLAVRHSHYSLTQDVSLIGIGKLAKRFDSPSPFLITEKSPMPPLFAASLPSGCIGELI